MSETTIEQAKREIDESLILSAFCMRRIGLSFQDPKSGVAYLRQKLMFIASVCGICYHVFSEIVFIGLTLSNSPRVEDVVPLFHTFGYGALSIAKVFVLWYKKDVFRQLLNELTGIWPMPPLEEEALIIKNKSLAALRITHRWYFFMNVSGVWFYNLTPIVVYLFGLIQGKSDKIGYVWQSWYPFDKHQTVAHVAVYLFEIFAGQTCVWIMVSTDLLFSAMASHISILLRLLKRRLEAVGTIDNEHYDEILANIKLHQRLITYCNDLENAFSLSNFVNIMLSSVNICCVVFVIVLLEPFMAISNKLFLGSALIQIGMLCWYADDIFHANADVAAAAYNSGWYRTNPRCRRALLFLIQRAQKPIAFTAMGFTNITLVTYSAESPKTDSIENQTLPSVPRDEEKASKNQTSQIMDKSDHGGYSKDKDRNAPKSLQQHPSRHHYQRKAYSVPKFSHHKMFGTTRAMSYNVMDQKTSSLQLRRSINPLESMNSEFSAYKAKITNTSSSKMYEKLSSPKTSRRELNMCSEEFIILPKLQPNEAEFLSLVSEDNVDGAKEILNGDPCLNVNCTNYQGMSALQMAVQNRSPAMVKFLLGLPNVEISDSVLQAIRSNNIKILVCLLEAQQKISPGLECAGATHSADFPAHVTPLILAAQLGHYEIVSLLIERGHAINRPHKLNCCCSCCRTCCLNDDPLYESSVRLSIYRAIASPAYMVHMCADPILASFRLAAELADNAAAHRQLAAAYLQVADDVSTFAVDLIGCCRTSEEVEFVLKQTTGCLGRRHFVLPRLLMAVDYKQKEFVAHPNTQQVLESYWLGDWHSWRSKPLLVKAVLVLGRVFITPFILLVCMVAPRHRLVSHWQIPLNKLITHVAAYFVFLALVFYISNQDKYSQKRGPPNTGAEAPLILYVCGYAWSALRMMVMQGPHRYFSKMWNWTELIMLTLFFMTFVFWVLAAIDVAIYNEEDLDRKYWNQHDPTLLAEGTFCLATIIAFFRLMFLCQLNYHLGPLQVSLGKMTIDIYKYIIIFAIIISAFTAGLARFYQYYDGMVYEDEFGMKTVQVASFTSLTDTLNTLFWALFCMAPLESADVVLENTRDPRSLDKLHENRHGYTERIGYFCFGCFEVISVIVVLNMLIATMSNTFQRVTDNVDIEWTFGKTEVYIDYMLQTTLPSPFNLIPTASGVGNVMEWFRARFNRPPGAYARWSPSYCCYIERDVEANVQKEYPALMSVLVQRYFRDKDSSMITAHRVECEVAALRRNIACIKIPRNLCTSYRPES